MRISYKIGVVGGIPIAVAAAIALFAWLLLNEAERARDGALMAGTVYRNLLSVVTTRDNYVNPLSNDRDRDNARFNGFAAQARRGLELLTTLAREPAQKAATAAASQALARYASRMSELVEVTGHNDRLISEMGSRAISLIGLTDQARDRQHGSNADIVASLREKDRKLRSLRDVIDGAHEVRIALAAFELEKTILAHSASDGEQAATAQRQFTFGVARLLNTAAELEAMLRASERSPEADTLAELARSYNGGISGLQRDANLPSTASIPADESGQKFADWCDRLIKVNSTEQRALQDEVAQLLTYSVAASEIEQATQNVAITTLKLGQRTGEALATRNVPAAVAILDESKSLAATVAILPISPLIQTEMVDAIAQWREGLGTTTAGLRHQNDLIADMDGTADTMINGARSLNDLFTIDAHKIGVFIRNLLVFGAAIGLLLGSVAAYVVARSITKPLRRLQQGMLELAADPQAGAIADSVRPDELGDMARAANFFVTEIGHREQALRRAKDRADAALAELQRTQADLIRAEKLASLGGLVAGVAHEINTPLGVALTTATVLGDESRRFSGTALQGQLRRSELLRFIERMVEGSQLLFANLTRAADLVHSFKQVSADQASGERRRFGIRTWLHDLLTSLGPALRKTGHEVVIDCPEDFTIDTYPGALAQVLTNLVMNSVVHGYDRDRAGRLTIGVSEPRPGALRIVFEDDGKGIAPDILNKVFDPFFTTGRSRGNTGLGLHIAFNLVTSKLQGQIHLDSQPGKGARFTIDLPVHVADKASETMLASA